MHRFTLMTLAVAAVLIGCTETTQNAPGKPAESARVPQSQPAPVTDQPARIPESQTAPVKGEPAPAQPAVLREMLVSSAEKSTTGRALDMASPAFRLPSEPLDRENYTHFDDNPVHLVAEDPVSTFSIDVDTAAYANVRRFLNHGSMPREDAVRIEELINYFDYDYAPPRTTDRPFAIHTELATSPWNVNRWLLHIGLKGFERNHDELPPANLVFLIDVSGSMQAADKLELLKASMKLLAQRLRAQDRVSIAVYAGAAGAVLEPTPGDQSAKIIAALDTLTAGGSTNGGAGIQLAYNLARQAFMKGGINRVILATDGDFNVGTVNEQALEELIEDERASGVGLSVLGFGTGNYNDALMQKLAQNGNGNAAYIDTLNEGRKVLVDELVSTLEIIAKDVKIQVEFNPAHVAEYRLIGYETRHLEREDFNNDKVDAGDIGAGHTVTAIYELTPADGNKPNIEPLRYGQDRVASPASKSDEIAFVRLRYKQPNESASHLVERAVAKRDVTSLDATSPNFRFSAAVAAFGQLLRGGRYTGAYDYDDVLELARAARGDDPFGYRGEFLNLVSTASALAPVKPG